MRQRNQMDKQHQTDYLNQIFREIDINNFTAEGELQIASEQSKKKTAAPLDIPDIAALDQPTGAVQPPPAPMGATPPPMGTPPDPMGPPVGGGVDPMAPPMDMAPPVAPPAAPPAAPLAAPSRRNLAWRGGGPGPRAETRCGLDPWGRRYSQPLDLDPRGRRYSCL